MFTIELYALPAKFLRVWAIEDVLCFPDPTSKQNHRRRIISYNLLTEYAYFLEPNGRPYTITDVKELHDWHVDKCSNHPYFERIPNEEVEKEDPAVRAMIEMTEEGLK